MPTYEYICEECGHRFESLQAITDDPLAYCPRCSGKVRRLIGAGAGLIFRGSGFYVTDYRKKPSDKGGGVESSKKSTPGEHTRSTSKAESDCKQEG